MSVDEEGMIVARITRCLNCRERGAPAKGRSPCLVDGADILAHARSGECPRSLYGGLQPVIIRRGGQPRPGEFSHSSPPAKPIGFLPCCNHPGAGTVVLTGPAFPAE
jgi:hypothetical protein